MKTIAALLLATIALAHGEGFVPSRVHLLDSIGNNLLFRGNEPLINNAFAWDNLTARMAVARQDSAEHFLSIEHAAVHSYGQESHSC